MENYIIKWTDMTAKKIIESKTESILSKMDTNLIIIRTRLSFDFHIITLITALNHQNDDTQRIFHHHQIQHIPNYFLII